MSKVVSPRTATTGWFKYLATNTTADQSLLADDIYEDLRGTLVNQPIPMYGWRGFSLIPFGDNAADETFDITIQHIEAVGDWLPGGTRSPDDFAHGSDQQFVVRDFAVLTCTLGATQGTSGAFVTDTDFIADTIVQNTDTFRTTGIEPAFSTTAVVFSPGSDRMAQYWVPDFGDAQYLHLIFTQTLSNSSNCLVKLFV